MSNKLILFFSFLFFACSLCAEETKKDSIASGNSLFIIPNASYQQETNVAFGVVLGYYFKSDDISRISSISGSTYYTLKNQFTFNLTPKIFSKNGKWYFYSNFHWQKYPDSYFGITNAPPLLEQTYTSQSMAVQLQPQYALTRNFFAGGILSFRNEKVKTDEAFSANKDFIFEHYGDDGWNPYQLANLGLTLMYDKRDNQFYPYNGFFAKGTFEFSQKGLFSSYTTRLFSLDVRRFFTLFESHVFAWQAYFKGALGKEGIPFQVLPTLGGRDLLRGFRQDMYRGNLLFVGQAEYRVPVYKRIKAAAFLAAGDVLDSDSPQIDKLKIAYGAGLRFRLNDARVHLRLDFAKNNYGDKLQFYITATEAF